MKVLFIVNPAAGHGRAASRWRRSADGILRELDAEVWRTSGPGDASGLARRGLELGFSAVIAVGGDGTLSEVVHGYLSSPASLRDRAALGTWPAGSGCDFARHLGIRAGADAWRPLLRESRIRRLDAGRAAFQGYDGKRTERFFLNIAALGLAGDVARLTQAGGKRWGGTLGYFLGSLRALLRARAKPLDLVVDGEPQSMARYHLVALANTSSTGGGMRIAPAADAQDGSLDMVAVGDLSRWELLRRFPKVYVGGHLGTPGVSHRKVRRLEASSRETVHLNIDGEAAGTLPAEFELLPAAVPFLCPI